MERISILGCGWFGKELAHSLLKQGYPVKGSTTTKAKLAELKEAGMDAYHVELNEQFNVESCRKFFDCDILVISSNTKMEGAGYLAALHKLCDALQDSGVLKIIFISSTSVYGDSDSNVDELTPPHPDKASGVLLLQAESIFTNSPSVAASIIRFGGLVGPKRMPGRFFSAKVNIPNGMAPVNLIHLADCIGITERLIMAGVPQIIVNAVSPHHPAKSAFYLRAALAEGLPVPTFKMELNRWKIVNSIHMDAGLNYPFKVGNWFEWLENSNENG